MFRKCLVGFAATGALALGAAPALASHEPFAFGNASRGSLKVVSGAFVAPSTADLRGVWLDASKSCNTWRSLRVKVLVDYSRGSVTRRFSRERTSPVRNCAEGGPNFGFTVRASRIGLACPNGRWKPGFYTFVVRTLHRATGIEAMVSLAWENRTRC